MTVAFDNLTLSQRVYEHLREAILADHLLPGTELSEVALSKELAKPRPHGRFRLRHLAPLMFEHELTLRFSIGDPLLLPGLAASAPS